MYRPDQNEVDYYSLTSPTTSLPNIPVAPAYRHRTRGWQLFLEAKTYMKRLTVSVLRLTLSSKVSTCSLFDRLEADRAHLLQFKSELA